MNYLAGVTQGQEVLWQDADHLHCGVVQGLRIGAGVCG